MLNIFKEKCPVCKMNLEKGRSYPEEAGLKFCSENCKEEYKKQSTKDDSKHSNGGYCH